MESAAKSSAVASTLSASTSNIERATADASADATAVKGDGQKASWPELTPRSLRKFAAFHQGLKFMNMLQKQTDEKKSSTTTSALESSE